jgi:hypothetical protein
MLYGVVGSVFSRFGIFVNFLQRTGRLQIPGTVGEVRAYGGVSIIAFAAV